MSSYAEATRWAAEAWNEWGSRSFDCQESTFAEAVAQHSIGIRYLWKKGRDGQMSYGGGYYVMPEKLASFLVSLSSKDPEFFDICARICSTNTLIGAELPFHFQIFASDLINGTRLRPKKSGRKREKDWYKHYTLWFIIKETAHRFRLDVTRNDEPPSARSACDAVAEALTSSGRKTTYSSLKYLMVHPDKSAIRAEIISLFRIMRRNAQAGIMLDPLSSDDFLKLEALTPETAKDIRRAYLERVR